MRIGRRELPVSEYERQLYRAERKRVPGGVALYGSTMDFSPGSCWLTGSAGEQRDALAKLVRGSGVEPG